MGFVPQPILCPYYRVDYEANIRREYGFASDAQYQAGRSHFLQMLLAKESIFKTDYFHHKYEASARANITKLINQLSE